MRYFEWCAIFLKTKAQVLVELEVLLLSPYTLHGSSTWWKIWGIIGTVKGVAHISDAIIKKTKHEQQRTYFWPDNEVHKYKMTKGTPMVPASNTWKVYKLWDMMEALYCSLKISVISFQLSGNSTSASSSKKIPPTGLNTDHLLTYMKQECSWRIIVGMNMGRTHTDIK